MSIMIPNASEVTMLSNAIGLVTPGDQTLKLFVNDITPAASDVAATYTEMSTLGYSAKTLTKSSWSVASGSGTSTGTYAAQTWTFSAGTAVTVYGYFVIDATSGLLLWSELFATPKVVQYAGDQITITPTITLTHA